LAIDSTGDTPHLYVSDPCNNRVLGFKDARTVVPTAKADIVIGQPDMQTALCNYPSGNLNHPTQSGLCDPIGLLVDSGGNLYVADAGNGRVLRFPAPFKNLGTLPAADRVVGQAGFSSTNPGPGAALMAQPYGLAFSGVNGLLVSDMQFNRVLYFPMANGDLTSPQGETATKVFGQPDISKSVQPGSDTASMNAPHHIFTWRIPATIGYWFSAIHTTRTLPARALARYSRSPPASLRQGASTSARSLAISGLRIPATPDRCAIPTTNTMPRPAAVPTAASWDTMVRRRWR
jgi:hypothetical protein